MDLELSPRRLSGVLTPPPSKSLTQRLLLCAALAEGTSSLHNIYLSDDVRAAVRCAEALGARCERAGETLRVTGCGGRFSGAEPPRFDCGESAAVLRFFLPAALCVSHGGVFTGRGRLPERPLWPYLRLFDEKGVRWGMTDGALSVAGSLPAGVYRLPGDVSSQFFSGLLMALPLADGASEIVAETPPESAPYIDLTIGAMALAGLCAECAGDRFFVEKQSYRPFEAAIEPDWSQAAVWIAARFLGNGIELRGLDDDSRQGDRRIVDYAARLSAPGELTLDVSPCQDLLPPLAAMAALREGSCRLEGAARLRFKESDRLASAAAALRALGAEVREEQDALTIRGGKTLRGGEVDCRGDHRIAMTAAVLATRCDAPVRLHGADCVKKSYPDFWEVYQRLGGECHVL